MGSSQYSFLDIVVLDEIRGRFADGDALVVLSTDLGEVLWSNGPGARLFGYSEIGSIIGAAPKMGLPAERQISSTPGYPAIGRDRAIAVRVTNGFTSRVVNLLASSITMPDGKAAILLVEPAGGTASEDADRKAERAIEGFGEEGQFTALVDGEGKIIAASPDFASLAIGEETLRGLTSEAQGAERLVKRRIPVRAFRMPAGLARLTDEPATHLLVVVDDGEEATEPGSEENADATPDAAPELVVPQTANASAQADAGFEADGRTAPPVEVPSAPHGPVDRWYFLHGDEERTVPPAALPAEQDNAEQDNKPAVNSAGPSARREQLATAPVKFVWRTGADGRFASISEEFAAALGAASADIVGRPFREVAETFGFDADGEIAGLLERRDTWSGRSVLWPVDGTDMRVPVDLAALPVYGRDRDFQGFRGFGVARMGDAVTAPASVPAAPPMEETSVGDGPEAGEPGADTGDKPDPFHGEVPALAIVPQQERRYSDKIIRLAEHRPAAPTDEGLSQTERNAFREIGARLRKDSEKRAGEAGPQEAGEPPAKETDADKVLPIARQTFGKRDWLKLSASREAQAEAGAEDAASPAHGGGTEGAEAADPSTHHSEEAEEIAAGGIAAESPEMDIEPVSAAPDIGREDAPETKDAAHEAETTDAEEEIAASEPHGEADGIAGAAGERTAAQQDLYRAILGKLPTPVLVHSGDELHYANEAFLRLTGYASLDAIRAVGGLGELFADPYDAGDEAGDRKLRLRAASGETRPVDALLQSVPWKGGKALMLALEPSPQPSGREESTDIRQLSSPRASADTDPDFTARLEELRAIIDTATDGVVLISPEGRIRSISRPAEALFGFDSDDVTGKPFAALFAMESQRAAQDYLQGLSDNGVASVLNDGREVIGREAQGRFIPLFMTIGRLPGDSGFCAVLRDVTQWKRAEEELTQARSQAEVASSQKTEFLARVSHEIRTPLNAIIGFSELMIDEKFGPIGNDRYRDYLRDINRSGNHVLDLVNDLLDISKIEAGEQEMNYEAVSLNDTLAETVALMQPQANRERVIIRSSFPSRLPEVVADLRSVRQIALNLLSNAIRYTQAGGQVIVSTSYEASGDIVMRVRDTGVGMSQAEIEQAMKPFKQVNALKRPRGDGTGLGLPLTKAMVEANRARFAISSTPGEGTLVEVTFPSTRVLAD